MESLLVCIFKLKITPMTYQPNFIKSTLTVVVAIIATTLFSQPLSTPIKDVSYTFLSYEGTNASAVVWVPEKSMYVTTIAGNTDYPIEGFTSTGTNLFATTLGFDGRGLWYNPATKNLEGNGAGEAGWYSIPLVGQTAGKPESIMTGQYQPDFQSVGAYDYSKKQVVFLSADMNSIITYSHKKPSKTKTIALKWEGIPTGNINPYALGFTGVSGYEYVCYDWVNTNLIFFDRKGNQKAKVAIPSDAPINEMFCFSFTNGRAFFYDIDNRTWTGYKVF